MIIQRNSRTSSNSGQVCLGRPRLAVTAFLVFISSLGIARAQQSAPAASTTGTAQSTTSNGAAAPATGQSSAAQSGAPPAATQQPASAGAPGTTAQAPQGQNANAPGANRHETSVLPETNETEQSTSQVEMPYANIPSLAALYTQVPFAGTAPQRFGSNAFVFGTGNANELPADIPVGPDFVLGPGDNIVLNLWGSQSNHLTETIDRQGEIPLPEAGTITINGMTIAQAQNAIQAQLNTQFKEEHAEISLGRVHTVRVYVVGDVQRPGAYDVSALSSALGALVAAGGPTSRGSLRILRQYRGEQLVREIDLYDLLLKGVRTDTSRLLPGDTLMVPPAGAEVTVTGMVHRPAIYELNGEQTLSQVLDLAGGVLATGSLKEIKVQRVVAHEHRTMLDLQLSENPAQAQQELATLKVQGGDDVVIAQILPFTQNQVFLEGHVYRPGSYPYREGMTVADLLPSSQVVLPEPSDRADLVRLVPPDYHPETIPINLHDILIGNATVPLQPFDLVRVYGRYQLDAPMVSIEGEVLWPGNYPMAKGMTVTALVKMAGGFKRSAYRQQADLSSYEVENGQKVTVNHSEVALTKALDGDARADVVLRPGDVVSIRQLSGWQDIGATVTINGEVEHPGTYSITPGERLSEVLERAGGFRASAYPPAAVLDRAQVRELQEEARRQMIFRIENTPIDFRPGVMNEQSAPLMEQAMEQQRSRALAALRSTPVAGRLVIHISSDISRWQNTIADIELRAGDSLTIPKRPNFVMIAGQVFNPGAISYVPGRNVRWYLERGGGPTRLGDQKTIYVVHADGSVKPRAGKWDTSFFRMRLKPGDVIYVPERVVGNGNPVWQAISAAAQLMYATTLPLAVGGVF